MNLLLLTHDDFFADHLARVKRRQFNHIRDIHKAVVGDSLRVGLINGRIGQGTIVRLDDDCLELDVHLLEAPPLPLPLTVLLALPRPKMLKRCLQHLTSLGVKNIVLMHSYRVEKSFWQSPCLQEDKINEQLVIGLEQAKDTVLPQVLLEKRFKPFVEDRLPVIVGNHRAFVAHPQGINRCPRSLKESSILAIGPEGGFISYEINMLEQVGFEVINLGARILKVETAVTALISKLYD